MPFQLSPSTSSAATMPAAISSPLRVFAFIGTIPSSRPSSGTSSHATPYATKPAPPKKHSTTNSTRRMVGSMLRCRPRPPATPAILRSVVLRRSPS